jgi:hypothetical protein
MSKELTAGRLRELLHYNTETGVFTRRVTAGGYKAGSEAGTRLKDRMQIFVDRKSYLAHRLAWLYTHGAWPADELDHIDGNGFNNRMRNLRECIRRENMQNTKLYLTSSSGFAGVSWIKSESKWRATITKDYKQVHLGRFDSPEAAHQAYLDAKSRLHTFNPVPRTTTTTTTTGTSANDSQFTTPSSACGS